MTKDATGRTRHEIDLPSLPAPRARSRGRTRAITHLSRAGVLVGLLSLIVLSPDVAQATCGSRIGDFLWNDLNGNGRQDPGEPGIPGVEVTLSDQFTILDRTITNATGIYHFDNLCAGTYFVSTEVPPGFSRTTPVAPGTTRRNDSNRHPARVVLGDYVTNNKIDFGFRNGGNGVCTGQIGDFVWHDLDRDGIQDAGEPGIAGVTVNLLNPVTNALLATDTTDANGLYLFDLLCAGTYRVQVVPPANFTATLTNQGAIDALDSDPNPVDVTLLTNNPHRNLTIDFGFIPTGCTGQIGDFVWNDLNSNGIQDAGEPGINGVTVRLKNGGGNVIGTATTAGNGFYQFTNLTCPATYTVEVDTPPNFTRTQSLAGTDRSIDSNGSPATVTLTVAKPTDLTIDFGFVGPPCVGTIGDFVWNDLNSNGIQDAGEPGINGVTVRLKDSGGNLLATTTTGPNGFYQFTNLTCPATYMVEVVTPLGFSPTTPEVGNDPSIDSNPSPTTVNLTVASPTDLTIDFGFVEGILVCPVGSTTPAGVLTVLQDATTVTVRFDQSRDFANDNSYGANAVGWPNGRDFSKLVTSDRAQFVFRDINGMVVFDFEIDYISPTAVTPLTPSGFATLGVSGGDGSITVGNPANIRFDTSLDRNLNDKGFCNNGNCTVAGVNLVVDSPPTVSNTSYQLPAGSPFGAWEFTNSYVVQVPKASFAAGFGSVSIPFVHNSPSKGADGELVPCPPSAGDVFCAPGSGLKPQVVTMQYTGSSCAATLHSQEPGKVTCTDSPGPANAASVFIRAQDKALNESSAKVFFRDSVLLNGQFDIDATAAAGSVQLGSDTYVFVFSDATETTLLQSIKFHTSCSQPLVRGDQFGSAKLVDFTPAP